MASKEAAKITPADKHHAPQQQGGRKPINYFDIMVIGKTGVGKSTTADKLLIANPKGLTYTGEQHEEPKMDPKVGAVYHEDICMWQLSDKEDEIETVSKRLKNLVFCRSLTTPHQEVNNLHREGESTAVSTDQCELISNDSTNIRVLDVPGFYGSKACSDESRNVLERTLNTTGNDLSIMRKILHIKMAKSFKFNRIVYFLPETGILERDSQILHTEISIMENYFGRSIFESMVVVATYPASIYKHLTKDANLFPPEDLEKTCKYFQIVMKRVFPSEDSVPEPPIIFISLFDTCETILHNIRESAVAREGVELQFNPHTCARCNIRIGKLKEDLAKVGAKDDVLATCAYDNNWAEAIPYEDSTCHPIMIPKYTKIQKIVGEIAHLITLRHFEGRWPSMNNVDEVCANCRQTPKSRGCLKVHTEFAKGLQGAIVVDHTSQVTEDFVIQIDPEEGVDAGEDDASPTGALVGGKFFAENSCSYRGYASTGVLVPQSSRGEGDGGEEGEDDEK